MDVRRQHRRPHRRAGRRRPALFPYLTDDRLREGFEHTGPKTVLLVTRDGRRSLWEPFSDRDRGVYRVDRHLYKSVLGHEILFEEVNHDLGLDLPVRLAR